MRMPHTPIPAAGFLLSRLWFYITEKIHFDISSLPYIYSCKFYTIGYIFAQYVGDSAICVLCFASESKKHLLRGMYRSVHTGAFDYKIDYKYQMNFEG